MSSNLKNKISTIARLISRGILSGATCGLAVALFNVCAKVLYAFAINGYEKANAPFAVVCIICISFLCLLVMAIIQTLCPLSKGGGIPLAKKSASGILKIKWLRTAAALTIGSFCGFASGLPLGGEAPSIGIGAMIGGTFSNKTLTDKTEKNILITANASAGLSTAFFAPVSGLCFAFEEIHGKRNALTVVTTALTIVTAVTISQLIFWGLSTIEYFSSVGVKPFAAALHFLTLQPLSLSQVGILSLVAIACGTTCAVIGFSFKKLIVQASTAFGSIKNNLLRLLPAFAIACVCGLLLPQTVGNGEHTFEFARQNPSTAVLLVLLITRIITTAVASGSKSTGGLLLPTIAIGSIIGVIITRLATTIGLETALTNHIICMCIFAFIASTGKTPITAMAMSIELTQSPYNALPCTIAIIVAYLLSSVFNRIYTANESNRSFCNKLLDKAII